MRSQWVSWMNICQSDECAPGRPRRTHSGLKWIMKSFQSVVPVMDTIKDRDRRFLNPPELWLNIRLRLTTSVFSSDMDVKPPLTVTVQEQLTVCKTDLRSAPVQTCDLLKATSVFLWKLKVWPLIPAYSTGGHVFICGRTKDSSNIYLQSDVDHYFYTDSSLATNEHKHEHESIFLFRSGIMRCHLFIIYCLSRFLKNSFWSSRSCPTWAAFTVVLWSYCCWHAQKSLLLKTTCLFLVTNIPGVFYVVNGTKPP